MVKTDVEWDLEMFKCRNEEDLEVYFPGGILLSFTPMGPYRLRINISDDTSIDDLRAAWRDIAEWRRRLIDQFGVWIGPGPTRLYSRLASLKKSKSYAQIAMDLNQEIVRLLLDYLDGKPDRDSNRFETEIQYREELERPPESAPWDFGLREARKLLILMGLREEEADLRLRIIARNLVTGRDPFQPGEDEPITKDHVRKRIDAWKKGQLRQKSKRGVKYRVGRRRNRGC